MSSLSSARRSAGLRPQPREVSCNERACGRVPIAVGAAVRWLQDPLAAPSASPSSALLSVLALAHCLPPLLFGESRDGPRNRRATVSPALVKRGTRVIGDRVLLPLPGLGTLDLPRELFERHLVKPAEVAPERTAAELVDAADLERRSGIPASWWMAQARERRVPFSKIGRYVRFDPREALECEAFKRRAIPPGATGCENRNGSANV